MSAAHDTIKGCLIELVGGMKAPDTAALLRALERLDAVVAAHRNELDPRFAHFLERRSYAKALEWLNDARNIPAGSCAPTRRAE